MLALIRVMKENQEIETTVFLFQFTLHTIMMFDYLLIKSII